MKFYFRVSPDQRALKYRVRQEELVHTETLLQPDQQNSSRACMPSSDQVHSPNTLRYQFMGRDSI